MSGNKRGFAPLSFAVFLFGIVVLVGAETSRAERAPVQPQADAGAATAAALDAGPSDGASVDAGASDAAPSTPPVDTPAPSDSGAADAAPKGQSLAQTRAAGLEQSVQERLTGILGILVILGLAFLMSSNRRKVSLKIVGMGLALQLFFAVLVLKTALGRAVFALATEAIGRLLGFTLDGARFVFGNLVASEVPVYEAGKATAYVAQTGSLIAFGVLPTILFFSALTALLYHLGILQRVVQVMAWVMRRTMGTSGAESLSASANIFVGQTEAPLLVRPFLPTMTQSELMAVMTGGFATVAGGVMAVYVGMLQSTFPDIAGHLLAASVMSAPASLVISKIMVPETETPKTAGGATIEVKSEDANVLDAITRGTSEGLFLLLNVGAMLLSFVALIALVNYGIGLITSLIGAEGVTLQTIFGYILSPLAFALGVPWKDAVMVGGMMGTKTVVNEFVAYLDLAAALKAGSLSPKSVVIATYALCGFSNIGSIGIQIGGLSTIAPSRRKELAQLGVRSMIAASLACFLTAAIAGILL